MNRIVAVPNWSFFDPDLCMQAKKLLGQDSVRVHYCKGDIDHQRTVTAFSGDQPTVFEAALNLANLLLPKIDLQEQHGVHPRVGALDVMPFVLLAGSEPELINACRKWASRFSRKFNIPYHLYEKAAYEGKESRLPYLRGQMHDLHAPIELKADPHPHWGVSIIGVRDFLLATNIDVDSPNARFVKDLARQIRTQREEGDPTLAGVRALGFELKSRGITQLSINMTQPNVTRFDDVYQVALQELKAKGVSIVGTELIGIIRERDLAGAQYLRFDPSQVVS